MKLIALFILVLCPIAFAMENDFSQETAELNALAEYEAALKERPPLPAPGTEPDQEFFGAHLPRALTLLAQSGPERRMPVRVMIYGQSIGGSAVFTEMLEAWLKERYPHADLEVINRSIGGFGADQLGREAAREIALHYPDLLIFHVYGGEKTGDMERIISDTRRNTTADILLFNHHQHSDKIDEASARYWRYLAQKYGCELADISREWPRFLQENSLEPSRLLRDSIHPNRDGNALLVEWIGRHLKPNPQLYAPWGDRVRTFEARRALHEGVEDEITFTGSGWRSAGGRNEGYAVSDSADSALLLTFEGNRVDLIAGALGEAETPGSARILIDGKPPSTNPRLYTVTRPTPGPGTWWPSIRKVSWNKPLVVEDWTLKIEAVNADASEFTFSVTGSVTGPDGAGNNQERFVSNSGRVVIEPRDLLLQEIHGRFKSDVPAGFEVTWSVVPQSLDTYTASALPGEEKVLRTTLAQGLENGEHTLEIIPVGDGAVPVQAIEIHRPSLR